MADLKTNYKDDVLNTSKNTKRKYNMISNSDGTVSLEDVTEYSQSGDNFGAADINATNTAVNELNSNLTANSYKFQASYKDGKYGFIIGDTFYPIEKLTPLVSSFINYARTTLDTSWTILESTMYNTVNDVRGDWTYSASVRTISLIDFNKINKVSIDIRSITATNDYCTLYCFSTTDSSSNSTDPTLNYKETPLPLTLDGKPVLNNMLSTNATGVKLTVDVSNITGDKYFVIVIGCGAYKGNNYSGKISAIISDVTFAE